MYLLSNEIASVVFGPSFMEVAVDIRILSVVPFLRCYNLFLSKQVLLAYNNEKLYVKSLMISGAIFICSTQLVPFQRCQIMGTKGRVEVEIPVNGPPDRPTRIFVDRGSGPQPEEFPVCNQYTLQGDEFSRAIQEGGEVPTPVEDGIAMLSHLGHCSY